jgi:exodeoxyribonuclease V gamma subunit
MQRLARAGHLRLLTHARVEVLCTHLIAELREAPLSAPLAPEWIIIPHAGFRFWLQQQLAEQLGIWAHDYLLELPAAIWGLARHLLADLPDTIPLEPGQMVWKILSGLPELLENPAFSALRNWIEIAPEQNRHWALASALTRQLDQAASYRPHQILAWESCDTRFTPDWAIVLWRFLRQHPETHRHRSALRQEFISRLRAGNFQRARLPERLTLFCPTEIPLFYQEMLNGLVDWIPVTVYLTEPFAPGHATLLGENCGEQRRLLSANLTRLNIERRLLSAYEPPPAHLLATLQETLCDAATARTWPADNSLRIDSVHSPLRALEVLKDYLYDCFQCLPALRPEEVVVMLPDSWLPLMAGVFYEQPHEAGYLPWSLFQPEGRPSTLANHLLKLMELSRGRLERGRVLALLEQSAVAQRFELMPTELEIVGQWLEAVEIRWGLDADHRAYLDLPAFEANSWTLGLRQLLLGFSLNGTHPFDGVLPYGPMEGQSVHILGKLLDFFAFLSTALDALRTEQCLTDWSELLLQLLDQLCLVPREQEEEQLALRSQILQLKEIDYTPAVTLPFIESWLRDHVHGLSPAEPLQGRILFGSPHNLAGIPMRVICLLGLDAGVMPRSDQPTELSLLTADPHPGDPSPRRQDRALFLEVLLAARDRFYVSYTGQNIRDNQPIPPSVLVAELQETLSESCGVALKINRQSLHPFAPQNFPGSWSRSAFEAAHAFQNAETQRCFIDTRLPAPASELNWSELLAFYQHPLRYFLKHRLALTLPQENEQPSDSESFKLEGLAHWQIRDQLLQALIDGRPLAEASHLLELSGRLPPMPLGRENLKRIQRDLPSLAEQVRYLTGTPLEALPFKLSVGHWQLHGLLSGLSDQGLLLQYRSAALKASDYLNSWLHHLLLACLGRPERVTRLALGSRKPMRLSFRPVETPATELLNLLEIMEEGLMTPLALSLETAWHWLQAPTRDKAIQAARQRWGDPTRGEASDPAHALCLTPDWWSTPESQALIQRLFRPLQAHCEETPL